MVVKLLNAAALGGWFNSARVTTSSQQKTKNAVVALREYKRNRPQQHSIAGQHLLNQRLYEENSITSLTYANKLYKRLPNETMAEFHARVLRTQ